jgi:Trypsin-like peptidase domain
MQPSQDSLDDLSKCTIAIQADGKVLGSGVIVTDDGLILTCYHIVRSNKNNKILDKKNFNVYFTNTKDIKPAEIIEDYCNAYLDIAFLQLQEKSYLSKLKWHH